MAQLVRLDDRSKSVQQLFAANMAALVKAAPRTTGDPNRLIRIAFNAITYNSDLVQCSHQSLLAGVMEAVKLGLAIGGPMQESWLIPFRNKGTLEATLIIGYQGYRNLVDRAKSVLSLHPRAVYANDLFDVDFGSNPRVTHKPYWMVGASEKGPLIAVYAVAQLRGGGVQIEVMPKAEVDEHRARSRAKDSGPWVSDYDAMALKTVIRKIVKYLPKQSEVMEALSRAMQLDDRADRGEAQYADTDLTGFQVFDEGPAAPPAKPKALDALKAAAGEKPLADPKPVTQQGVPVSPEDAKRAVVAGITGAVVDTAKAATAAAAAVLGTPAPVPAAEAGAFFVAGLGDDDAAIDAEAAKQDSTIK